MQEERRPTYHLNNGGEPQAVDPETQRYESKQETGKSIFDDLNDEDWDLLFEEDTDAKKENIYNKGLEKEYYDENGEYLEGILENTSIEEAFKNLRDNKWNFELFVEDKLRYLGKWNYNTYKKIIDAYEHKKYMQDKKSTEKEANKDFRSSGYIKSGQNTEEDLEKLRKSGKTKAFSEERMKNMIDSFSRFDNPNYGGAYTTFISPQEFLELTIPTKFKSIFKQQEFKFNEEEFEKDKSRGGTQYLGIDFNTGSVIAHEGRHRMAALMNDGFTNVQILIIPYNKNFNARDIASNKIPDKLRAQTFIQKEGRASSLRIPLNKKELVALTSGNVNNERKEAKKLFGLEGE